MSHKNRGRFYVKIKAQFFFLEVTKFDFALFLLEPALDSL
jgi:hypothetical protein